MVCDVDDPGEWICGKDHSLYGGDEVIRAAEVSKESNQWDAH